MQTRNKRSLEDIKYILKDIKTILEKIYTGRLVSVIFYGSFAKNKATEESDIALEHFMFGAFRHGVFDASKICNFRKHQKSLKILRILERKSKICKLRFLRDITVVLKGKVDKISEIDRIHDSIYFLGVEHDELISVNPLSEEELKDTKWPLYYHIQREGIKV